MADFDEHERRKIGLTPAFVERLEEHMDKEDSREDTAASRSLRWHLGKEVPLALIFVLLTQTVGVIWWAASTSAKVDFMKEANVAAQIVQTAIDRRQDDDAQRAELRIITQLANMERKIDELIKTRSALHR